MKLQKVYEWLRVRVGGNGFGMLVPCGMRMGAHAHALVMGVVLITASAWGQTLVLKDEAVVEGDDLTLVDVLETARGLPTDLLGLRLGSAPPIGAERKWMRKAVAKVLKKHYEGTPVWDGAEVCLVRRPGVWIKEKALLSMLGKSLEKLTGGKGKVEVHEIKSFQSFAVPGGDTEVFVDLKSSVMNTSWGTADIRFVKKDQLLLKKTVKFRWSWIREGWRSTVQQRRGVLLAESLFEKSEVDILTKRHALFYGDYLPNELVLARGLPLGEFLTKDHLKAQVLVKRGFPVMVHYERGGIKVSMEGVALQDGSRHQKIVVRNMKSQKKVAVRVLDERNAVYLH